MIDFTSQLDRADQTQPLCYFVVFLSVCVIQMSWSFPPTIKEALQKARWNEIVEFTVETSLEEDGEDGETDEPEQVFLVAELDTEYGGVSWNPLPHSLVPQYYLQAKRWIVPMLNDHERNQVYLKAIQAAVEKIKGRSVNDDEPVHVLDIGSGTGLLGMVAARELRGGGPFSVTSVEMSSAMAKVARKTIEDNNLSDCVHVVEGHSSEIPPLTTRAHLCVSEILESGLVGEGIIPTLRDAWSRHLQPDAIMIPQKASVYAQLVEGEWIMNYFGPHCRTNAASPRFSLDKEGLDPLLNVNDSRIFVHAQKLLQDQKLAPLTDPIHILDLDFSSLNTIPGPKGERKQFSVTATASGVVHGILVWWELNLWENLVYSTKPGAQAWQDHWHQCIFPVSTDTLVSVGDCAIITVIQTEEQLSVTLMTGNGPNDNEHNNKRIRLDDRPTSTNISPFRCFQLNDQQRLLKWQTAIRDTLAALSHNVVLLDVSDFCYCACIAALSSNAVVYSIESSGSDTLAISSARVAQIANELPKAKQRFEILQCHPEHLSVEILGGQRVGIITGAEYYHVLEGWHIQEALNFKYLVRSLQRRNVLASNVIVIPWRCRLMACGIESCQLRSAYAKCGNNEEKILGFDHSYINQICDFSAIDISLPTWQYDFKILTENFELCSLAFAEDMDDEVVCESVEISFSDAGMFDALMYWTEFDLLKGTPNKTATLSTLEQASNQMIRMTSTPRPVNIGEKLVCKLSLGDPNSPSIIYSFGLETLESPAWPDRLG